ncbi:tail fiber protein [Paenibacillus glucanolyticus]|uniref:tail fiber protein n=1 Tax=Paenibacillus glucanolyticus TaxID=59843 RepID=UPI0030CEA6B0
MSSFGAKGLTNKGRVLQAKAQAGVQLKYTKYVLGDAQLGGQSIATLTGVISPKKTVDVTRLKMTPPNQATVGFVLSNQDVTTGFYFRELGLYALDPDEGEILYWYANAGDTADYIPPTNTGDVISKTIDMLVYVGTASNVTLTIDQNLAYVTHDELAAALEGLDPDIPLASLTEPGITQLSNAINSTSDALAATPSAVKKAYDRADQAFTAGNERKAEVVAALVAIGVSASTSETWEQLIPKIAAVIRATGNATVSDVIAGKTFSNATANGLTGNIPDRGAGGIVTPGTTDQTKAAGRYTSAITIKGEPNLIAGNLPKDKTFFGITGLLERMTTSEKQAIANAITAKGVAASVNDTNTVLAQKIGQIKNTLRSASGSLTVQNVDNYPYQVTNLAFKPVLIVAQVYLRIGSTYTATSRGYIYADAFGFLSNAANIDYYNPNEQESSGSSSVAMASAQFGSNSVTFTLSSRLFYASDIPYVVYGI